MLEAEAFFLLLTFLLILLFALQRFWTEQVSFAKSLSHTKRKGEDIVQKLLCQKNTVVTGTEGTQYRTRDYFNGTALPAFPFLLQSFILLLARGTTTGEKNLYDQNALSAKSFCQLTAKRHQHFLFLSLYPLPSASEK